MTEIHSQISESGIGGAFTMSIIAFTVVFLVLGGLSAIIYGIKYLAIGVGSKKDAPGGGGKPQSAPPAPAKAAPAAQASTPSLSAAAPDRGRLLAVLTAAIAAAEGRVPVIRSVTRAVSPRGGEEWKRMGIIEGHCTLSRNWK
ncbi:MAG: OadG family protein [Synergistaceae bacterium]|nr:OadG family protein [Synergistaceae bacterium]